jgi:hypothetical protein
MVKSLGQHEEAVSCFREVVEVLADLVTEKLYIPYCLYELGESYYTVGKVHISSSKFILVGQRSRRDDEKMWQI